MSKKSSRSSRHSRRVTNVQRYTRSAMPRNASSPLSIRLSPLRLLPLGDGRIFHPMPKFSRPFAAAPRAAARLVESGMGVRFQTPSRVAVCVRRKMRKEVLFAIGVGGQSGKKNKPRKAFSSAVSC